MIFNSLQEQIFAAMKAKDEVRLSTLKLLSSALSYEKIAKMHDLTEEEELVIVAREVKKRKESIEAYKSAIGKGINPGVTPEDRIKKEEAELAVLSEFLPKQLTDEELVSIIESTKIELGVSSIPEMGKLIGGVKAKVGASADGSRIAALVKAALS